MTPSINRLRLASFIEGLSWLALIAAMIYRHLTNDHTPVSWTGRVHGGLFCLFCLFLYMAFLRARWNVGFTFIIFLTSLVPLGFLVAEPLLRRKARECQSPSAHA